MEKGVREDTAESGRGTGKTRERGMLSLGNKGCERSRERLRLEKHIEARWIRAYFAKPTLEFFVNSEKVKEL